MVKPTPKEYNITVTSVNDDGKSGSATLVDELLTCANTLHGPPYRMSGTSIAGSAIIRDPLMGRYLGSHPTLVYRLFALTTTTPTGDM